MCAHLCRRYLHAWLAGVPLKSLGGATPSIVRGPPPRPFTCYITLRCHMSSIGSYNPYEAPFISAPRLHKGYLSAGMESRFNVMLDGVSILSELHNDWDNREVRWVGNQQVLSPNSAQCGFTVSERYSTNTSNQVSYFLYDLTVPAGCTSITWRAEGSCMGSDRGEATRLLLYVRLGLFNLTRRATVALDEIITMDGGAGYTVRRFPDHWREAGKPYSVSPGDNLRILFACESEWGPPNHPELQARDRGSNIWMHPFEMDFHRDGAKQPVKLEDRSPPRTVNPEEYSGHQA